MFSLVDILYVFDFRRQTTKMKMMTFNMADIYIYISLFTNNVGYTLF